MEHSTYRGLAFLLSLGTLPLACKTDEGTTDSGTGTTTGPGTSSDGSSGASSGTSAVTDTSGTDSAGTSGTSGTSGSSGSSSGDPTGGPGGICEQYAAFYLMCDPSGSTEQLLEMCQAVREEREGVYGPACLALHDAYLACIITGGCEDTNACDAEAMATYYCKPEIGAICQAYGAKYMECMLGDAAATSEYCQIGLNTAAFQYGPACGTAYEELIACLTALDCAELENPVGCEAQMTALSQACQ